MSEATSNTLNNIALLARKRRALIHGSKVLADIGDHDGSHIVDREIDAVNERIADMVETFEFDGHLARLAELSCGGSRLEVGHV